MSIATEQARYRLALQKSAQARDNMHAAKDAADDAREHYYACEREVGEAADALLAAAAEA